MNEEQKTNGEYPYRDSNKAYLKTFLGIVGVGIIGLVVGFYALKYLIVPLGIKFIYWLVPNFWNGIWFVLLTWIVYKLLKFLWSPIYSLLGKWSYVILGSTIIYIILQIS